MVSNMDMHFAGQPPPYPQELEEDDGEQTEDDEQCARPAKFSKGPARPQQAEGLGPKNSNVKEATGLVLPIARIKRIVKQESGIKAVAADAGFAITKATELFLQGIAGRSAKYLDQGHRNNLHYDDVAGSVAEWKPCSNFLQDIVPARKSVRDLAATLQQPGVVKKRKNPTE